MIHIRKITVKNWKESKCPEISDWINKLCCSHIIEYYSAINKSERLVSTATWMKTKIIMLSERSQTTKESIKYDSIYVKL